MQRVSFEQLDTKVLNWYAGVMNAPWKVSDLALTNSSTRSGNREQATK